MSDSTSKTIVPPAIPRQTDDELRSSFAKTALSNPSLMIGVKSPEDAASRALDIADSMIRGLRRRNSSLPKIKEISVSEMREWEASIEKENARGRETVPSPSSKIAKITPTRIMTPAQIPMTEEIPKSLCENARLAPTAFKGPGVYRHLNDDD